MKRKVCIVTGTRAEYGLLYYLMKEIQADDSLELQIVATCMHLSPEFDLTYKVIEADGFLINKKIEMLLSSDTAIGTSKSMGLAVIGFAEAYADLTPDLIVVLGDRFELLAASSAALVSRIPIAHIHGGEITRGVFDDAIRHAITKMSHIHFTSCEEHRKRVIQLGEQPHTVFNLGALGIENIRKLPLLSKRELEERINFSFGKQTALVTYHPVTLEEAAAQSQFQNLLNSFDYFKELKIIFTKANADPEGRIINGMIDCYVNDHPDRSIVFASMGQLLYLSAMKYVNVIVGNSSSGIIEAPSLKKPTVNIGNRQRGRVRAKSVLDCGTEEEAIVETISMALSKDFIESIRDMQSPFEQDDTAKNIKDVLKTFDFSGILDKEFFNLMDIKSGVQG